MMHQLNNAYPDATPEELERMDENCAICLRHLDEAKRLPCNHYFHRGCLQRLMENGGTPLCPICRQPLFNLQHHNHGGGENGGGIGVHLGEHRRRRRARVARDVQAHLTVINGLFSDCPELLNNNNSTPNLRQGQRLISRRIQKRFGTRYYGGTVVRVWQAEAGSHGRVGVVGPIVMYRINYDDGDREDMEWNELSRLLVGITAVGTLNGTGVGSGVGSGGGSGGGNGGGSGGAATEGTHSGARVSRRRRKRGATRNRGSSAASPLKNLIMTNIVPVRLHDWTGRSWLYLFSTATTVEDIIRVYASDRKISSTTVTLRTFDPKKRTIRTTMLQDSVSSLAPSKNDDETAVVGSSVNDELDECQVFAYVDFSKAHPPSYLARYLTTKDLLRLKEDVVVAN